MRQPQIRKTLAVQLFFIVMLVIIAGGVATQLVPWYVDIQHNTLSKTALPAVSPAARQFHGKLFVADMHADSLLWNRDLSVASTYGHLDLPRMRKGNLALQVFSIVTKTPHNLNIHRNKADSDNITYLAIAQAWPLRTWFSLAERVLYQCNRLQRIADDPANHFAIIRNQHELATFLTRRHTDPDQLAGVLSIEGAHALEGNLDNIERFYQAGVRLVGLAHFFDTRLGGSAHGVHKGGLTDFGRRAIKIMLRKHMIIDLAHSSAATFNDVMSMTDRPVIVSHTGIDGTCHSVRNLTDTQLRQIAAHKGIVGIGFWPTATCGTNVKAIVKAIRYTVDRIGVDYVALGSDFDGSVKQPFDVSHMAVLTQALLQNGFSHEDIRKIMGSNVVKFLQANLPG